MSRPQCCPQCGSPLRDGYVHAFSVGPHDFADGGYHVICQDAQGALCWLGDVFPSDEARGGYSSEDAEKAFSEMVADVAERTHGRFEHLLNVMASYESEKRYRMEAHLNVMSDEEIRAFQAVCDEHDTAFHGLGFESFSAIVKKRAEAVLGKRRTMTRLAEHAIPHCTYHNCAMQHCMHLHPP